MTTDQTIDGVPRVLIAQAIKFLEAHGSRPSIENCIADDLRALLNAEQPAPVAPTPINYGALDPVERLAVCRGEQVRMCDCNQGRMPCNGKCAPASTS